MIYFICPHINVRTWQEMQPAPINEENADTGRHFECTAHLFRVLNHIGACIICIFTIICIPFKDFFASVQRASKRDNNNRTPGEGTCFELGNKSILPYKFR